MNETLSSFRKSMMIMGAVVLAIIAVVNYFSANHHVRFDLTGQKEYSLAPQTLKLLKSIDAPLTVRIFDKSGSHLLASAADLLEEYKYHCKEMQVFSVDPDRKPALSKKYNVNKYGTIILEYKGKTERVERAKEDAITNGILKLTRDKKKTIYFLSGHGEGDWQANGKTGFSMIHTAILKQNYAVKPLVLMREKKVPADCYCLVILGPEKSLMPAEETMLDAYLNRGGKAFILLNPTPDGIGMTTFLAKWGVVVGNDVIVDEKSRLFGGDYFMPVITQYNKHPITEGFSVACFLPLARSVKPAQFKEYDNSKLDPRSLAFSSNGSWAETNLKSNELSFDRETDTAGPISIAVTVRTTIEAAKQTSADKTVTRQEQKTDDIHEGALVVLGDSDLVNNSYFSLSGNSDFFLNVISWLAEEGDLISIRPKEAVGRALSMTNDQMNMIFYLVVIVMPLIVIISGIVVFLKRRRTAF